MAEVCTRYKKWVEEKVEKPVGQWEERSREKCKRRKCKWWCACCNKWFCWIETFLAWVVKWIIVIVGKWVFYWSCLAVATVVKYSLAALFIVVIIISLPLLAIFSPGFPVWGNYCGPGHGDLSSQDEPIDKVDELCMLHDMCYEERGYFNCKCDLELIAALPAAIASEGPAAAGAGTLILAYFSIQTTVANIGGLVVSVATLGTVNYSASCSC